MSVCLEKRAIALALDALEKERDAIKKSDAGQLWRFFVLAEAVAHFICGDSLGVSMSARVTLAVPLFQHCISRR